MKAKYITLTSILTIATINSLQAQVRSNHSYRNLGFTQAPVVSVNGYIDVNAGMSSQDSDYSGEVLNSVSSYNVSGLTTENGVKNRATDDPTLSGEASLIFKVNGLNDYGLKYGAVMELNANSTYNSWNDDINATRAFIYGEGMYGRIEAGSELGASQKMKIDASSFARAGGGINGKYLNFINLPSIAVGSATNTPLFIVIPELPTAHGGFGVGYNNLLYFCDANGNNTIDSSELTCYNDNANDKYRLNLEEMQNSMKISYYTPEIYGFQAGISYTPDTGNKGVSGQMSSKLDTGDVGEVLEGGVSYINSFSGVSIALSATGQTGTSESKVDDGSGNYKSFREDLMAYQFGGNISYYGLTIGGSIGNWGNSLYNTTYDKSKNDGSYMTAGLAYEFAGVSGSLTYISSEFQDNEYTAYSIGLDYKMAKGFLPYIEYTGFEFKAKDGSVEDNSGFVILTGLLVNF